MFSCFKEYFQLWQQKNKQRLFFPLWSYSHIPPPPCEVCQYSDPMLKHLPQKSLDNIEKVLLFRKKKVTYRGNIEKRANNSNVPADITDEDFDNRINRFANLINPEENYRIP